MLAYSLLTLAAVQAILLAIQDHHLRSRHPGGFVRGLPPLQTMESLLFEMIAAGFVLLTLALVSGFAFLENMFAQHLVHKTVLSTLAWLVFGGLLLGRFRYGWRGTHRHHLDLERLCDPDPGLLRQQGGTGTCAPALGGSGPSRRPGYETQAAASSGPCRRREISRNGRNNPADRQCGKPVCSHPRGKAPPGCAEYKQHGG